MEISLLFFKPETPWIIFWGMSGSGTEHLGLSFGYFMSSLSSSFAENLFILCKSQGISGPAQTDQLNIVLGFPERTAKPAFAILALINNKSCDLPKLCPRDISWGTVWRISSVCKSNPAGLDCKMRYNLSTLFAGACYTSSRQAICYLTNTTNCITTVFQNVFDVPNRACELCAVCPGYIQKF